MHDAESSEATPFMEFQLQKIHAIHLRSIENYSQMKNSLVEELELYRTLIPDYKILAHNKRDRNAQENHSHRGHILKKKEIIALDKMQESLLDCYQNYLTMLISFTQKKHPESQSLGSRCIAELVNFAKNFNFNQKLLWAAVQNANSKHPSVSKPCLLALQEVLACEGSDEACVIVVDLLLDLVRARKHALNPRLLYVLLYIRVRVIDIHRTWDQDSAHRAHSNAKKSKKDADKLSHRLQTLEGTKSRASIAARQTRLFHKVMTIYLRVLEASQRCSEFHQSLLLAPTLEGLVKYAHLMNVELYDTLLSAIRDLLQDNQHTSLSVALHALVTVTSLAEQQAKQLPKTSISSSNPSEKNPISPTPAIGDLQQFHDILYALFDEVWTSPPRAEKREEPNVLLSSAEEGEDEKTTAAEGEDEEVRSLCSSQGGESSCTTTSNGASSPSDGGTLSIAKSMAERKHVRHSVAQEWSYRTKLLLSACEKLLVQTKRLPVVRIAAFVSRAARYLPHLPCHLALGALQLIQSLLRVYPTLWGMLQGGMEHTSGVAKVSKTHPHIVGLECASPDYDVGAQRQMLWELSLLRRSYHPGLRQTVQETLKSYRQLAKNRDRTQVNQKSVVLSQDVVSQYDTSKGGFYPQPQIPKKLKSSV